MKSGARVGWSGGAGRCLVGGVFSNARPLPALVHTANPASAYISAQRFTLARGRTVHTANPASACISAQRFTLARGRTNTFQLIYRGHHDMSTMSGCAAVFMATSFILDIGMGVFLVAAALDATFSPTAVRQLT